MYVLRYCPKAEKLECMYHDKECKNSITDLISPDGFVEIYTLCKGNEHLSLIYLVSKTLQIC